MIATLTTLLLLAPTQASSSTQAADRAAIAAEHAAQAAAAAAESAARAAEAMEKTAAAMSAAHAAMPAAAVGPAAAAAPAAEEDAPVWTANIGANMVLFAGNSEQVALGADLAVERKTKMWILSAKLNGGYGESTSPSTDVSDTTALFLAAKLRADLRFTETLSGYVAALADTDHVKAIEFRTGGEVGGSMVWFEEKVGDLLKASLRTDFGMRAEFESRYVYYGPGLDDDAVRDPEDASLIAPRLGIGFIYGITPDATFTEDAEILPNILPNPDVEGVRVLINSTSKLSFKLTTALSFATSLALKFDSIPAADKDDLDVQLTVGLSVTL